MILMYDGGTKAVDTSRIHYYFLKKDVMPFTDGYNGETEYSIMALTDYGQITLEWCVGAHFPNEDIRDIQRVEQESNKRFKEYVKQLEERISSGLR